MTIPPPLEPEDGEIASRAFGEYLKAEGLLSEITEAQCARLAKVFLHGFAAGSGNAVGKMRVAEMERTAARAGAALAEPPQQKRDRLAEQFWKLADGIGNAKLFWRAEFDPEERLMVDRLVSRLGRMGGKAKRGEIT